MSVRDAFVCPFLALGAGLHRLCLKRAGAQRYYAPVATSNFVQYSAGTWAGWTIHDSGSYDRGMRSPPPPRRSSGHQVVYLKCLRCGHEGRVPPERLQEAAAKGRRLSCRKCRGYAFQTTVVWHGGPPPDNIVPLRKRAAKRNGS